MCKMKKINKIILGATPIIYLYFVFSFIYDFCLVRFADLLGKSIDYVNKSKEEFKEYAIEFIIITLISIVLIVVFKTSKNYSLKKIFYTLRSRLVASILNKDVGIFCEFNVDYYVGALVNDVKIIEEQYITALLDSVTSMALLIFSAIAMFKINIESAIFVLIVSSLAVFVPMFFNPKLQKLMGEYMEENNKYLQEITEQVEGYETFKNYNKMNYVEERFSQNNNKLLIKKNNAYLFLEILMTCIDIFGNVITMGILIFGMFMALKGKMSVGSVFSLMIISGFVVSPISELSQVAPKILGTKEVIDKYNKCCANIKNYKKKAEFDNKICCRNENLTIDDRKLLSDVNVEFIKGKKYAVVGGSGSGKSTLVKSLLGFYTKLEGNVYYDMAKLSDIDKNSVFNKITYLAQNSELFDGTVRDNLTMFNNSRYSDNVLYEVLELVNMKDKIIELEKRLDTVLKEKGNNFSGGEKQRIGIARALLKGNNVFVMDEITSALDYDNYINVERILLSIVDATVISITHRLEAKVLKAYDCIFVMDKGQLVESGSFDELMRLEGYFANLYNAQLL